MDGLTLVDAAQRAYGLLWREAYPSLHSRDARHALFGVLSHEERRAGIAWTMLLHGPMSTAEIMIADIRAGVFPDSSVEATTLHEFPNIPSSMLRTHGQDIEELDRLRTENAALSAELDAMCANHQSAVEHYRALTAQLASARADYAAALSALELANMPKVHGKAMYRAVELLVEANTRAERAEAERDALREALERIASEHDGEEGGIHERHIARVALAQTSPSPCDDAEFGMRP